MGVDGICSTEQQSREREEKLRRIQDFIRKRGLGGLLVRRVRNFAWATGGVSSQIVVADPEGVVWLLFLADRRRFALTSNSESARVAEEELTGLGYELREYRWFEDKVAPNRRDQIIKELLGGRPVAADLPYRGAPLVQEDLVDLQSPLTPCEVEKYRWLGRETAKAVDAVARALEPGMSERQMEAMTASELMKRQIQPTVLLLGVDDRIVRFRHALPTGRKLERYAMINICASRWGLVVAMTRFVHFGPLPEDLAARLRVAARVEATLLHHTRPGASADSIFQAAQKAFAGTGYPEEWTRHHQGGAIGYYERDWVAVPGLQKKVRAPQAFAWNPTVQGTKVEDTILVTEAATEVLTEIPGWPALEVEIEGKIYRRPGVLVR